MLLSILFRYYYFMFTVMFTYRVADLPALTYPFLIHSGFLTPILVPLLFSYIYFYRYVPTTLSRFYAPTESECLYTYFTILLIYLLIVLLIYFRLVLACKQYSRFYAPTEILLIYF